MTKRKSYDFWKKKKKEEEKEKIMTIWAYDQKEVLKFQPRKKKNIKQYLLKERVCKIRIA